MPKRVGTVGQLLVNEILPQELRSPDLVLDKKGLSNLLSEVAKKYPDQYRDITFKLSKIGREAAYSTGGNSFGLKHLLRAKSGIKRRTDLQKQIDGILDDDNLSDKQRDDRIVKLVDNLMQVQQDEIFKESMDEKNPLAMQLVGAGRGNKMNLASLRGSDGLYQDHRDRIIPIPVLRSYSQGLAPIEYWANTYGARQGVMAVKFATQDAGYFGKQLNQINHRMLVTGLDRDKDPDTLIGLPVDIDDDDSDGSLLAADIGGYKRNTILTPKILNDLRKKGIKRMLVRSAAVSGAADGGVYARDVGVREFNRLPVTSENVGLTAAQALSEPLSQAQLSAKHAGGVAGASKAVGGFDYINQLVQVPKTFKGGAAHAEKDGIVQYVEPAPAGGMFVGIDGQKHYVGAGFEVQVKPGDKVEAGDVISDGEPNPGIIVKYKGVGEGRRYFTKAFVNAMRSSGIKAHRRNVELLARGLINHVRLTDEFGDYAPDDIVPYSTLEAGYRPREGFRTLHPKSALGKYLERPYLHYTIGTQIKPSMMKDLEEFGVNSVDVHDDPPGFEPEMIRGAANLQHDPDFMTRMFGSGLKGGLLDAVHRGGHSSETGTSFVAGRSRAVDFGRIGQVRTPKSPPTPVTTPSKVLPKATKL
jgi:hypothetical protein